MQGATEGSVRMVFQGVLPVQFLYGMFFLIMALVHIAMEPAECDEIWTKGCENKIPFVPTCLRHRAIVLHWKLKITNPW